MEDRIIIAGGGGGIGFPDLECLGSDGGSGGYFGGNASACVNASIGGGGATPVRPGKGGVAFDFLALDGALGNGGNGNSIAGGGGGGGLFGMLIILDLSINITN